MGSWSGRSLGVLVPLLLAFVGCGGGGGGTSPPPPPPPPPPPAPVASVVVTPAQNQVQVGGTAQLAAQPRDAAGNALNRPVSWSSSANATATVNQSGLVTGVAPGNATISATSEGVPGTAAVEVLALPPVVITQIAPAILTEGQAATITGSGFSPTPISNDVRIGGLPAPVSQASATSLSVTVPVSLCLAKGSAVTVRVTVDTRTDDAQAPVNPASFLSLNVGEQRLVQFPFDRCFQFDAAAGNERYVVGVQSVSSDASVVNTIKVVGDVPGGTSGVAPLEVPAVMTGGPTLSPAVIARLQRWSRHLAATSAAYERERPLLQSIVDRVRAFAAAPAVARVPSVPGTVIEGQVVPIRVAQFGLGNSCTQFATINAKIRKITQRGVFAEDEGNPVLLDQAVIDQAAADFGPIYDLDVDHFGAVGDFDQNQRVVIVITKEVNKASAPPLGFVTHANLLATTACAGSNEGEYFFMRSPDPAGLHAAGPYTVADLVGDINVLLVHEFAHNIQGARRLAAGGQFMVSWLAEGMATAAQEMAGFALTGRSDGNNYGRTVAYTTLGADPRDFFNYVSDWIAYFGYNFAGGHVPGTPEQCTWVGNAAGGNPGPCSFPIRLLYGVPWSLIKYQIDRRLGGPANQKTITRQFSNLVSAPGFPELEAVLGQPIAVLMAEWAPMLWIDDRYLAAADHQYRNWNIRDIVGAWQSAGAELQPRIRGFADFADEFPIRAGSTAFFEVSGGNRPATALRVREPGGGAAPAIVSAWVVRVQ